MADSTPMPGNSEFSAGQEQAQRAAPSDAATSNDGDAGTTPNPNSGPGWTDTPPSGSYLKATMQRRDQSGNPVGTPETTYSGFHSIPKSQF
jgi:hypothetical protein